jgi:hypothetical protein
MEFKLIVVYIWFVRSCCTPLILIMCVSMHTFVPAHDGTQKMKKLSQGGIWSCVRSIIFKACHLCVSPVGCSECGWRAGVEWTALDWLSHPGTLKTCVLWAWGSTKSCRTPVADPNIWEDHHPLRTHSRVSGTQIYYFPTPMYEKILVSFGDGWPQWWWSELGAQGGWNSFLLSQGSLSNPSVLYAFQEHGRN